MKTSFNEIVNVNAIGKMENPISMNELLAKAGQEKLQPSHQDKERVLFLAIDMQNDFMEGGALPVSGSLGDVERATKFIYMNVGVASDGIRFILDCGNEDLKNEFIEILKSGKEVKMKRFINKNQSLFKDDVSIVF